MAKALANLAVTDTIEYGTNYNCTLVTKKYNVGFLNRFQAGKSAFLFGNDHSVYLRDQFPGLTDTLHDQKQNHNVSLLYTTDNQAQTVFAAANVYDNVYTSEWDSFNIFNVVVQGTSPFVQYTLHNYTPDTFSFSGFQLEGIELSNSFHSGV